MARKPMVTRTIITTECNVLALDITKGEPFNAVVTLPRTYSDPKKLLTKVQSVFDTDEVKAVHVVDTKEIEVLYGMAEDDFIKVAKPLDPKTRKELEEETATADTVTE